MNPLELAKKHPIATGGIVIVLLLIVVASSSGGGGGGADRPSDAEIASQTQIAIATLNAQTQSGALGAQLQMMGMQFALQREELGVNKEIGLAGLQLQKEGLQAQKDLASQQLANDALATKYAYEIEKIKVTPKKKKGGIFSNGLVGAIFSDERLKHGIKRVGTHSSGVGLYAYEYEWGGGYTVGVLAQEVMRVNPGAVSRHQTGFYMVDYSSL